MRAALLALMLPGCMASTPQHGQTPAQVQACSSDSTWHNILTTASGILAGGASTEATVAAADPGAGKPLAIGGAITAGVGGGLLLAGEAFGQAYTAQGCGAGAGPADAGAE